MHRSEEAFPGHEAEAYVVTYHKSKYFDVSKMTEDGNSLPEAVNVGNSKL